MRGYHRLPRVPNPFTVCGLSGCMYRIGRFLLREILNKTIGVPSNVKLKS